MERKYTLTPRSIVLYVKSIEIRTYVLYSSVAYVEIVLELKCRPDDLGLRADAAEEVVVANTVAVDTTTEMATVEVVAVAVVEEVEVLTGGSISSELFRLNRTILRLLLRIRSHRL